MLLCKAYHCLIHLPISRESSNESYCEQAFRLIDQRVPPPSRFTPVTLRAQALSLWKNTPYLRLRDSTGISPVFLSSLGDLHLFSYPPDTKTSLRHLQRFMQFYRIIGVVYLHTTDLSRDSSRIIISYYCLSKQQGHSAHISLGIHRAGGM